MAFHQNGATMTLFARDYTANTATGWVRIGFNIWSLALIAASVYTLFGTFQAETGKAKIVNGATYEIDVTLFEDFGALRYVTVVENTGQNEINSLENR
jgi:POT family proton-dependent oligopeptide transporter